MIVITIKSRNVFEKICLQVYIIISFELRIKKSECSDGLMLNKSYFKDTIDEK